MKFLADENFPLPSAKRLRVAGYDVAAVIIDSPCVTDEEVLRRAVREERVILTFDRDFGELLFRSKLPAPRGVVYFRFEPATPEEPADYLLRLLAAEGVSLEKKFTVVDIKQVRQRPLAV
jgi:predicted nuclease of predicted toxin-antitoxin system